MADLIANLTLRIKGVKGVGKGARRLAMSLFDTQKCRAQEVEKYRKTEVGIAAKNVGVGFICLHLNC